jgi:hypothetical protein
MRDRVLERKLKKLDNADRPKKEKVPSYLKSTLPSTKFILQPTDIQKMLPYSNRAEYRYDHKGFPEALRRPAEEKMREHGHGGGGTRETHTHKHTARSTIPSR